MLIEQLHCDMASPPLGSYSQGIIANGFLFTSSMGPINPVTGFLVGGDISIQTRQVLKNLSALLNEYGVEFSQVVKVTSYLQNLERDFEGYDLVYREFFSDPFPARATVGVGSMLSNVLVGIDIVAAI